MLALFFLFATPHLGGPGTEEGKKEKDGSIINDEASGGDESRANTKKDVDDILAKAKEEDTLKEHGIKPPYPLWMDSVPFPTKFK